MCAQIRQGVADGTKAISHMAISPANFPLIAKLQVRKRFPKNNQVMCRSQLSIVVLAGEGEFLWWNHPENRFEKFRVNCGDVVDVPREECFSFEGELSLLITSLNGELFVFNSVSID